MKFITDKHRICQIDRFAQFSCKITNNYQNAIFFYEISYTKPRHMIDYPRENRFLIPILENSQNFRATYYSLQKQQQIGFLLKHPNNFQPLANNPPKSNTCSTYLSLISSYTVHRTHKNQEASHTIHIQDIFHHQLQETNMESPNLMLNLKFQQLPLQFPHACPQSFIFLNPKSYFYKPKTSKCRNHEDQPTISTIPISKLD
jgi:hypothetical protein